MFHIKFGFNSPSGFRGEDFEYYGNIHVYLTPKVTLHFLFLNKSSFVLNCNKASIGVCFQHVSEHNACKTVDIT